VADHIAMRCHLLADALQRSERYHAVASTPQGVLHLLEKARLDALPFDVLLVGIGAVEDPPESARFIHQIHLSHPELDIIVISDVLERNLVVEAFRSGAQGIFCRSDSFESLCKCIRCVHEGQVWANSQGLQYVVDAVAEHGPAVGLMPGSRPLSKREEEITFLVAEGYSNRQISERLDLSEHTIKNYLFRVFEKLGVTTRVGLALYALKRGKSPSRGDSASVPPGFSPRLTLAKKTELPS